MRRHPQSGGAVRALWPAAPLLVWGAHFGALYAIHALACERGLAARQVLGLGFVPALAVAATLVALLALLLLARPGLAELRRDGGEGREGEPAFRLWFAAAATLTAALAILFETMPALILPAC